LPQATGPGLKNFPGLLIFWNKPGNFCRLEAMTRLFPPAFKGFSATFAEPGGLARVWLGKAAIRIGLGASTALNDRTKHDYAEN